MTEMPRYLLCGALLALVVLAPVRADDSPVSRLPRISDQPGDPVLKQLFDDTRARGGQILNLHLTQGHAPKLARARRDLGYAIRFDTILPPLLREIAILRTSQILESEYDRNRHVPLAKACGLTDAQLDALAVWQGSDLFDKKTQAMLAYIEALVLQGGEVDDEVFNELAKHFNPQEIVEITLTVGNYFATGIFTKALKVRVETDGRGAVRGKC